jgi:acyl-coenzyme A thioesterase PaaI-like protein
MLIQPDVVLETYGGLLARAWRKGCEDEGLVQVDWEISRAAANPFGAVQGGIVATVLDETAVLAGHVLSGGARLYPALNFSTEFFAPTAPGAVSAFGRVRREGKSTAFLEAWITSMPEAPLDLTGWSATMSLTARPVPAG